MAVSEVERVVRWIQRDRVERKINGITLLKPQPSHVQEQHLPESSCPQELRDFYSLCDGIWFGTFQIASVAEIMETIQAKWFDVQGWGEGSVTCFVKDGSERDGSVWACMHDPNRMWCIAPSFATWLAMLYLEYKQNNEIGLSVRFGVYAEHPSPISTERGE